MHYCTLLITKELPTNEDIRNILEPYDEEEFYNKLEENPKLSYPTFVYDWYQIGGRYSAMIKLKVDYDDDNYEWKYYAKNKKNNRLFISSLLNTLEESINPKWMYREEDYFNDLGVRDGFIRVDGAKISDIINLKDIKGYNLLVENGECITRSYYNGNDFIENENYDKQVEEIFEKHKDSFLTILDIHD